MPAPRKNRSDFMRRLAYYLMGLAIGFMMLGLMWQAKQRQAAAQPGQATRAPDPGAAPAAPSAAGETGGPAPASNTGP